MIEGIAGKVALVTGAARPRSIGRATAIRLAREGADVACLDIAQPYSDFPGYDLGSKDDLDELVGIITSLGRRSIAVQADVTSSEQVIGAVDKVSRELGGINILVNCAGGAGFGMGAGPLLTLSESEMRKVVDVNLIGTWLMCRSVATKMIESGGTARIVNISSQAGKRGFPLLGAYCAAKAGVILLTQVLALELGPAGITVNAICPGTVDTDLLNKDHQFEKMIGSLEAGGFEAWVRREIPVGRIEEPEDVAGAVCFLCSNDGGYITGEALNVSGGQTMV